MCQIQYNERSWAIDLISEINAYLTQINRSIKRGGGENTLISQSERLFPDVLLFGGSSENILQGWELKFPDTPITDTAFIKNAKKKAIRLKLNSFLLWNVTTAVLYIADENGHFVPKKNWNGLYYVTERAQVKENYEKWVATLHNILDDLNDFFDNGELKTKPIIESLSNAGVNDIISRNYQEVAAHLKRMSVSDARFDAEVKIWWKGVKIEHGNDDRYLWKVLAKEVLVEWVYKFIFAHILKTRFTEAACIEDLNENNSIEEAHAIFKKITGKCDFWNIFNPRLGSTYIPDKIWLQFIQLNQFLKTIKISEIDQDNLQQLLQNLVYIAKRKIAGQYITPKSLSRLLVLLTVENKNLTIFDPCCGTGTIARIAYDVKCEYGILSNKAISDIWASDKFSFPIQISTLSLTNPANFGEIINVFQKDITKLSSNEELTFYDPINGESIVKNFPSVDYIVANLPFVQQEDIRELNPDIDSINSKIKETIDSDLIISSKSDLYAYLPFYLWFLLKDHGKAGIIISNSWLGTDWGDVFRNLLGKFFHIEKIVISGKGKWFSNAKVVTTFLILKKRSIEEINRQNDSASEETSFIVLKRKIEDLNGPGDIEEIASKVLIESDDNNDIKIQKYSSQTINIIEEMGLEWVAMFADILWLPEIGNKLIKVNQLFEVNRGERRGWDALFFPNEGHGIEAEYLQPVLKSSTSVKGLIADADGKAFCCSRTLEELEHLRHRGALDWIKRFENVTNTRGKPLVEALARANMHWYELKPTTLADLIANINYDERIFIARMKERSFVNQRLTRFTDRNAGVDLELCHALLNSILSIFYLEAMGFGRGLGVLDLNATKLKNQMHMLNPALLNPEARSKIKEKFSPLLTRPVKSMIEEVELQDRIEFENTVLSAFEMLDYKEKIIQAWSTLYKIRKAVRE